MLEINFHAKIFFTSQICEEKFVIVELIVKLDLYIFMQCLGYLREF